MLTGDKYTTAVQIATSCNLITSTDGPDQLLAIYGNSQDEILECMEETKGRVAQLQQQGRV